MEMNIGYISRRIQTHFILDIIPSYLPDSDNKLNDKEQFNEQLDDSVFGGIYDASETTSRNMFNQLDKNKTNTVTLNEFKSCLIYFGINLTDRSFWKFIEDDDNGEELEYDRFCALLKKVLLMNLFRKSVVQQTITKKPLSKLSVISYSKDKIFVKEDIVDHKTFYFGSFPNWASVIWISVSSLEILTMKRLAISYNLNKLTIDNCIDPKLHSRIEVNVQYLVISLPMFIKKHSTSSKFFDIIPVKFVVINKPHTSINTIITMSSSKLKLFSKTRQLLNQQFSGIRSSSAFLLYHLIDEIIDSSIPIINDISNEISKIERQLSANMKSINLNSIYHYKGFIVSLKKSLKPVREVLLQLIQLYPQFATFYNDALNQLDNLLDDLSELLDTYKGMNDQYNLQRGNILAEVMYILAGVTTVFAPCSFLTGLYGMNFEYMPELEYQYSYLIFWILVIIIMVVGITIFKKISSKLGLL